MTVHKVGKKLLGTLQFAVKKGRVALKCQLDTAASCNVLSLKDHRSWENHHWRIVSHRKLGEPPLENSVTTLTVFSACT